MAKIRKGEKQVLLVVDVQVGVLREVWQTPRVVGNIVKVVEKARMAGVPVIWVQHSDDELIHGSPDWQLVPELVPVQGETLIDKHFNSSFEETTLEEILSKLGVAHIFLCGAASNWCIRATAHGALDRGYDLTLIKDAHTTESMEFEDGITIPGEYIIREVNVAMTWLSFPGRSTHTVTAEEVDFTIPEGKG
jgi:nicotinamidase-related amidase